MCMNTTICTAMLWYNVPNQKSYDCCFVRDMFWFFIFLLCRGKRFSAYFVFLPKQRNAYSVVLFVCMFLTVLYGVKSLTDTRITYMCAPGHINFVIHLYYTRAVDYRRWLVTVRITVLWKNRPATRRVKTTDIGKWRKIVISVVFFFEPRNEHNNSN